MQTSDPETLAVAVAAAALVVALLKYASDRETQLASNAVQLYRRFLELAVQHPELAEPMPGDAVFEDRAVYRRYEWFVGVLLRACEALLEHRKNRTPKWELAVAMQLRYHARYLREDPWFTGQGGELVYSQHLRRLVRKALEE